MRLTQLDLIAFGPFTDRCLQFAPGRVEVIYGSNGAGKSSALRGLIALLYGIEMRTTDDHVHEKSALRVGAVLGDEQDSSLAVVRHKTRKASFRVVFIGTALLQAALIVAWIYFRTQR